VKEFDLAGCPVYFDLVGKEKHEPGTPFTGKAARAEAHTPKWKESETTVEDNDAKHETLED
jgi:GTP-binding protein